MMYRRAFFEKAVTGSSAQLPQEVAITAGGTLWRNDKEFFDTSCTLVKPAGICKSAVAAARLFGLLWKDLNMRQHPSDMANHYQGTRASRYDGSRECKQPYQFSRTGESQRSNVKWISPTSNFLLQVGNLCRIFRMKFCLFRIFGLLVYSHDKLREIRIFIGYLRWKSVSTPLYPNLTVFHLRTKYYTFQISVYIFSEEILQVSEEQWILKWNKVTVTVNICTTPTVSIQRITPCPSVRMSGDVRQSGWSHSNLYALACWNPIMK